MCSQHVRTISDRSLLFSSLTRRSSASSCGSIVLWLTLAGIITVVRLVTLGVITGEWGKGRDGSTFISWLRAYQGQTVMHSQPSPWNGYAVTKQP